VFRGSSAPAKVIGCSSRGGEGEEEAQAFIKSMENETPLAKNDFHFAPDDPRRKGTQWPIIRSEEKEGEGGFGQILWRQAIID